MHYSSAKQKWGKYVAILLVLTLALSLTACAGGSKGTNNNNGSKESVPNNSGSSEAPMEISWLSFEPPAQDDTPVQKYIEERFNVKIKPMRLEKNSWAEQLNIKLAGGEIPDLFFLWDSTEIQKYSNQGLLAKLPVDEIKSEMSDYAATVDELDETLWHGAVMDGENYAIPLYYLDGSSFFRPAYNGNWLKAVGYEEAPKTFEELEDVLYKFTNEDPDKNNKKDTFGYSPWGKGLYFSFSSIFGMFGIHPNMWATEEDGSFALGIVTERAREGFKILNKWYKDGVIEQEFVVKSDRDSRKEFVGQKSGMFDGERWSEFIPGQGGLVQEFEALNNEVIMGDPISYDGKPGSGYAWGMKNNFIGMGIQVEKDPAKKAKIYEILNALAMDKEAYITAAYGVEGTTYDLDVDGIPIVKPQYIDATKRGSEFGASSFFGLFFDKSLPMEQWTYSKEIYEFKKAANEGRNLVIANSLPFHVSSAAKYPDLSKLAEEYFIKFIIGEVDLDKGFDDFVELWYRSGGQDITDEVNKLSEEFGLAK
ncbi:extracellular solute-binding protein [Paenibacillus yanchengensis]|uniref:Extracellular solute-binding protein n=1 Tax=Paenibacillus yanchengensis TaxID=2035833 RepID=A0ABW4YP02_9BACL